MSWCGPYAIAVLLPGTDYAGAVELVRRDRKRPKGVVKAMWASEIVRLINASGVRQTTTIPTLTGTTLAQWYRERSDRRATYLIKTTSHFLVVRGTRIIDNCSKAWEPFHLRRSYKRSRVAVVYRIDVIKRKASCPSKSPTSKSRSTKFERMAATS